MIVTKSVGPASWVPGPTTINISLAVEEAKKLRRVCYYNKTVGAKVAENVSSSNGDIVKDFMHSLGNALKYQGIDRF